MDSKIKITPPHRDIKPSGFYVYIHHRLTDGTPFYVGKGSNARGWQSDKYLRSSWWTKTALKNLVKISIAQDRLTESEAFLLEMWLIAKLRHEGHNLVNISEGGSGISTGGHKESTKEKISIGHGGKKVYCSNGMDFNTPSAAKRWLKSIGHEKAQGGGVSSCCRNITMSYLGYAWSYEKTPDHPEVIGTQHGWVSVRRDDGAEYKSLDSAAEAIRLEGKYPKASGSKISISAKSDHLKAYGHKWYYTS